MNVGAPYGITAIVRDNPRHGLWHRYSAPTADDVAQHDADLRADALNDLRQENAKNAAAREPYGKQGARE